MNTVLFWQDLWCNDSEPFAYRNIIAMPSRLWRKCSPSSREARTILHWREWRGGLVVRALDQRPRGRGFRPLAAGSRVATVVQLLFAPWTYSTLHPLGVGKWVPATAGKQRHMHLVTGACDAALCAPCTWGPLWWLCLLGALYQVFDLLPLTNGINQDGTKVTEGNDGARYQTRYDHNTTEACVTHACPISYELPKFQNCP